MSVRSNAVARQSAAGLAVFAIMLAFSVGCDSTSGADKEESADADSRVFDSQAGPADGTLTGGDEVRSEKARLSSPQVSPNDLQTQVDGNNAFAFDLYAKARDEQGNLFFSPHSITIALAMLYGGARNVTEQQMAQAMHYVLTQEKLHPIFNKLDLELNSRGEGKQGADGGVFRLNIVNAIWGQKDHAFLPTYLDLLALNYGAGLRVLDFESDPEKSRTTINQWVEQETEQRIKDLLPQGAIIPDTRLVLTNAIYFNAAWASPFEEEDTVQHPFHRIDGSKVTVPMLSGKKSARFAQGQDYQAVALPYDGHELSMVVIVPDAGEFQSFETAMTAQTVKTIIGGLSGYDVTLELPRFEFDAKMDLADELKALGMTNAFSATAADLSGIDGARDLMVTGVFHKAFVKVNEKGTEAAAATSVAVGATSVPPTATLTIDRPFIFLIRDHATGAILFVGRVLDPS